MMVTFGSHIAEAPWKWDVARIVKEEGIKRAFLNVVHGLIAGGVSAESVPADFVLGF